MAKNESQAKHLTSLDFEISGILESLRKVDEETQKWALQAGKSYSQKFQEGFNSLQENKEISTPKIVDEKSIKSATEQVELLSNSYGKLAKVVGEYNKSRENIGSRKTFIDERGIETLIKYNEKEEELTYTVTNNLKKQEQAVSSIIERLNTLRRGREEARLTLTDENTLKQNENLIEQIEKTISLLEKNKISTDKAKESISKFKDEISEIKIDETIYKKEQKAIEEIRKQQEAAQKEYEKQQREKEKLVDDFYKKNTTVIDLLINEQEKQGYRFSAQLKEQMQLQAKQQAEKGKLVDDFYKRNKNGIDLLIEEQERQSKTFSAQLKEQMTLRAQEEEKIKKIASQTDKLIEKQTKFNNLVESQKGSTKNREILSNNEKLISSLKELSEKFQKQSISAKDAEAQLEKYQKQASELSTTFETAGTKGESFLQKISDKAKWLGAFYVVNELKNGFFQTIDIIRETEDAVVDLQRVLNDDGISQSKMSEELYNIAYEYGRTFEEVAEVSTAFAQAGNDWADTIELTRGTMLALNTAELDVTQSTQGLIAIMSQWNFKAEDYAEIIDKINKTADNFAVTSENIVAALQRSSSSAKNANISFEKTIGIITALAEATGRSGENIGTALNSLIIYTSKENALKTFAEIGSESMKQVVKDYQQGAASIYEVWKQLSKEVSNLSAQQQSVLFESSDFQELAATLETELKDVYGAAGTYRQNYFIALLNDMDRAQAAIEEMAGAEGYSLQENEKYMKSLTANWNQLQASLRELAVQLGEAGLLDTLKWLTDVGIGLAKITKQLGGVVTVGTAITGILITINAQKITKRIGDFVKGLREGVAAAKNFAVALAGVATAENKVAAAGALVNSALGWLGIITTAVSALVAVFQGFTNAMEAQRQKSIELSEARLQETEGIENLYTQYLSLQSVQEKTQQQSEEFATVNQEIIELLGDKAKSLEKLKIGTNEYTQALEEATKAELGERRVALKKRKEDYGEQLSESIKSITNKNIIVGGKDNIAILDELEQKYLSVYKTMSGTSWHYKPSDYSTEAVFDYYNSLAALQDAMEEAGEQSEETAKQISQSYLYEKTTEVIGNLKESFDNYLRSSVELELNEKLKQGIFPKTAEELEKLKDEVFKATGANDVFRNAIEKIVSDTFPSLASATDNVATSIQEGISITTEQFDQLKESMESLSGEVDNFQSAYSAVNNAIQEYNENGYLSVDTVQQLIGLGSEYGAMLEFTANGISLNESATNNLLSAQAKNIDEMIRQAAVSDSLQIVQKYLGDEIETTGDKAADSMPKLGGMSGKIQQLIIDAWEGTTSVNSLANEIAKLSGDGGNVIDVSGMQKELSQSINYWKDFSNNVRKSFYSVDSWNKNAASTASSTAKSQTDALKKQLEAQKEAIKDRYDAEIEALKEVQEQNDRLRKQEEYYRNRQEALRDITKAETRSGVEYREQEEEARLKLEELDREWQETVADWSIEDKIAELEKLRDAEIAALDAQIKALENTVSNVGSSAIKTSGNANKVMLDGYNKEFLKPVEENTMKTYEKVTLQIPELFANPQKQMLDMAEKNSKNIFSMYQNNFFSPMSKSLFQIQQEMFALKTISPTATGVPFGLQYMNRLNQNNVSYSTTQNANVFANVYNQSAANTLMKGIFTKP